MRAEKTGAALLLGFVLLGDSLAGTLGDFEDAVDKPRSSSHSNSSSDDSSENKFMDDIFGDCLATTIEGVVVGVSRGVKWLVYDWWAEPSDSPAETYIAATQEVEHEPETPEAYPSKERSAAPIVYEASESEEFYLDDETVPGDLYDLEHRLGTAVMPYVRFDYRWQYLSHDIDANDFLLETGYRYVALYGRFTRYEDRALNEDLDTEQYYGLLRIGGVDEFFFVGSFQIGLGVGGYVIKGDETHGGAALTVPAMLYPSDWLGIEFRPAWASINWKTISDYDISISVGSRLIHLRTGYRWLWVQGEGHWLDGPYAGVSAMF